jgi:hypothetical protein
MPSDLVTPILSALIAAAVSFAAIFLGRRSETLKQLESIRTAAYADFIRAIAGLAMLQREAMQEKEHFAKGWELQMLLADAKARIAIYGGESVVPALANFLRGGPVLDSPERARGFTAVCEKMRGDSGPPGTVSDQDMHFLLFGFETKTYLP